MLKPRRDLYFVGFKPTSRHYNGNDDGSDTSDNDNDKDDRDNNNNADDVEGDNDDDNY